MRNCLIVVLFLLGCFAIALFLLFGKGGRMPQRISGANYIAGTWRDYDDGPMHGLQVTISPVSIILDVPTDNQPRRITEKGHWTLHSFYVDSNLDVPPEVIVASELKNEDLEINLGHFVPGQPDKVTLVMVVRGFQTFNPYPVNKAGLVVNYPPPKGLIRPGMLEWDLQMLPWHADRVDLAPSVFNAYVDQLSDGKTNKEIYGHSGDHHGDSSEIYTYHRDHPDATALLGTVDKGRVIKVTGGAEETADAPYRFPTASNEGTSSEDHRGRSWAEWLFDLIFTK